MNTVETKPKNNFLSFLPLILQICITIINLIAIAFYKNFDVFIMSSVSLSILFVVSILLINNYSAPRKLIPVIIWNIMMVAFVCAKCIDYFNTPLFATPDGHRYYLLPSAILSIILYSVSLSCIKTTKPFNRLSKIVLAIILGMSFAGISAYSVVFKVQDSEPIVINCENEHEVSDPETKVVCPDGTQADTLCDCDYYRNKAKGDAKKDLN